MSETCFRGAALADILFCVRVVWVCFSSQQDGEHDEDQHIEIMMTGLSKRKMAQFFRPKEFDPAQPSAHKQVCSRYLFIFLSIIHSNFVSFSSSVSFRIFVGGPDDLLFPGNDQQRADQCISWCHDRRVYVRALRIFYERN